MADRKASDVLNAAADLLEGGHWTQGGFAEDAGGTPRHAGNKEAVKWCAWGALIKVADTQEEIASAHDRLYPFFLARGYAAITSWNDAEGRTEEEIVNTFRRAARDE